MVFRLWISVLWVLVLWCCLSACSTDEPPFKWPLRTGFPEPVVPADNPMTASKVALGRMLFYDKRLSANQTQSCASCHLQANAFAEPVAVSVGSTGESHRRNALALVNIAYNKTLTWAHSGLLDIEQQILLPMFGEAPVELGITGHEADVLSRFDTPEYRQYFKQAFPDESVSFLQINQALASFVRSLISFDSAFDRYAYDGDDQAMSASAVRGMDLFFSEKTECHHCHGGFNFTQSSTHAQQRLDNRPFHNTGLYSVTPEGDYPASDNGLYEVSLDPKDKGQFRAPTLRNITKTAPYMHDGSIETLSEVIDFYAAGGRIVTSRQHAGDGRNNPLKDPLIKGFNLSADEKQDLLAFLESMTDETFLSNPAFADPFASR